MRRAVGFMVFIALVGGATWIGLAVGPGREDPGGSPACGLALCSDEALIEPEILIESCPRVGRCNLVPYKRSVFFSLIDLDTTKADRCGPGDCGAASHAFQSGWEPGRWRIVSPRLKDYPYLERPEPVDITIEPGGTYPIRFIYRDELRGWPRGPFAHNCLPENSDGAGDFDGDGLRDRIDFYPAYSSAGFVGWSLRQRFGDGRAVNQLIEAECPEVIGAADIDGDERDELFFDTGKGMTAALVDLLVYRAGKLREIDYQPKATTLYVGGSNAATSDLSCYPTEGRPVLEITTVDHAKRRITATTYVLIDDVLRRTGTYPIRGNATGKLACFGLRWKGY